MANVSNDLLQFENELIRQCGFSNDRFHKVRNTQYQNVYRQITEKYADKTKT